MKFRKVDLTNIRLCLVGFRFPYNVIEFIKLIPRNIKIMYQRIRYGISDYDAWNLDSYFTKVMINGLRMLGTNTISYPGSFENGDAWKEKLLSMADLFEKANEEFINSRDDEYFENTDKEKIQKDYLEFADRCKKDREEVFKFLSDNWLDLWN